VTRPVELTVATPLFPLDQETTRPDNGVPFWAIGVAVNCWVPPAKSDAELGLTSTEATGAGETVMVEVPV
jgi:hypothetical protein